MLYTWSALTITLDWAAAAFLFAIASAGVGALAFLWKVSNATKYQGRRQKKIIKAIFKQGRAMRHQGQLLIAIRTDQKRIMENMAPAIHPSSSGDSKIMDALPDDLGEDGLFSPDDLSDDEDD